jgi:hypothetical protein
MKQISIALLSELVVIVDACHSLFSLSLSNHNYGNSSSVGMFKIAALIGENEITNFVQKQDRIRRLFYTIAKGNQGVADSFTLVSVII